MVHTAEHTAADMVVCTACELYRQGYTLVYMVHMAVGMGVGMVVGMAVGKVAGMVVA